MCLNGCVPPNMTKGFDVLTKYPESYTLYPGAESVAPNLYPQQTPKRIQSTMRVSHGWNAVTLVQPPGTGATGPNPMFVPGAGTPVRLYICEVCGYTELYAGGIVDPKTWGTPEKIGGSGG